MNLEQEVKTLMRRSIMEEINGLGIRAAIRESIEASGISKQEIRKLVEKTVDSYVRSADVVAIAEKYVDTLIKSTVKETVKKYIEGSPYSYSNKPREILSETIRKELFKEWNDNYSLTVTVNKRNGG